MNDRKAIAILILPLLEVAKKIPNLSDAIDIALDVQPPGTSLADRDHDIVMAVVRELEFLNGVRSAQNETIEGLRAEIANLKSVMKNPIPIVITPRIKALENLNKVARSSDPAGSYDTFIRALDAALAEVDKTE